VPGRKATSPGIEEMPAMDLRREAAIRARAHQLWVQSGYADGYQDQHWRQAEREISAQSAVKEKMAMSAEQRAPWRPRHHSDGMSLHPSVIDPGPRAGTRKAAARV
jgi:hypothetical protein